MKVKKKYLNNIFLKHFSYFHQIICLFRIFSKIKYNFTIFSTSSPVAHGVGLNELENTMSNLLKIFFLQFVCKIVWFSITIFVFYLKFITFFLFSISAVYALNSLVHYL